MAYFLYGLFFVSCLVLIGAVLLQPGKTDAGALFTSNISSTSFTPRGAQSVLSKLTIIAATCFMLSALLLSMPGLTGNISVLQTTGDTSEAAVDSNANTATDANTAVDANANTAADSNTSNANAAVNTEVKAPEANVEEAAKPDTKVEEKKPEAKKPEEKKPESK